MDEVNLPYRLKRLREARGISQGEMAQRMGFKTQPVVSRIESGDRKITAGEFVKWAGICGTTPDAILNGDPVTVSIVEDLEVGA